MIKFIKWIMNLMGFVPKQEANGVSDAIKNNPNWPFPTSVRPAVLIKPVTVKNKPRRSKSDVAETLATDKPLTPQAAWPFPTDSKE